MALVACGECGREVSDRAVACPHCGAPPSSASNDRPVVTTEQTGKRYKAYQFAGGAVLLFGLIVMFTAPPPSWPGATIAIVGAGMYFYGRIAGWWQHG
jgi:hypothetical protein